MKTILTPHLLEFLISEGYSYFLSKIETPDNENPLLTISLVPVKKKPIITKYSLVYKSYFNLNEKLWQLASGLYNTKVWVVLDNDDVLKLKETFLRFVSKQILLSHKVTCLRIVKTVSLQ